jgi:hypothetical protein
MPAWAVATLLAALGSVSAGSTTRAVTRTFAPLRVLVQVISRSVDRSASTASSASTVSPSQAGESQVARLGFAERRSV